MELKTIVVDNSPELKQRLVTILSGMEDIMVCKSFDDAVAAMQYIEENPVDLVFSDVVMPEISGITLASMIYDMPRHPEVILLSGIPGFPWRHGRSALSVLLSSLTPGLRLPI